MSLANDFIKHRVFLDRFARTLANEYKKAFKRVDKEIDKKLGTLAEALLKDDISLILEKATVELLEQLQALGIHEEEFTRKVLERRTKIKPEPVPEAIINQGTAETQIKTSPNTSSVLLIAALPAFAEKKTSDYIQIIQDGQVMEESKEEVKAKTEDKSTGLFATQITALAALSVAAVATGSRQQVMAVNKIDRVMWVNDLESNVCPFCAMLNREIFEVGNTPTLPAHANCNCDLVPV